MGYHYWTPNIEKLGWSEQEEGGGGSKMGKGGKTKYHKEIHSQLDSLHKSPKEYCITHPHILGNQEMWARGSHTGIAY